MSVFLKSFATDTHYFVSEKVIIKITWWYDGLMILPKKMSLKCFLIALRHLIAFWFFKRIKI